MGYKVAVVLCSLSYLLTFWPQRECFTPTQAPTVVADSPWAQSKEPSKQGLEASKAWTNKPLPLQVHYLRYLL